MTEVRLDDHGRGLHQEPRRAEHRAREAQEGARSLQAVRQTLTNYSEYRIGKRANIDKVRQYSISNVNAQLHQTKAELSTDI